MKKKTLLIEIGTEELPSRLLSKISLCFYENFIRELNSYNITYKSIKHFSTPRRLALKITDIDTTDKFIEIKKRGPSILNSYDKNGFLTEAAICWLKHCKININQASHLKNEKGEWLLYKKIKKQENTERLIPKITELALKKIFIKKAMRWEENNQKFFRPIRNIVILLDNQIISGKIFNVSSNNLLQNHLSSKDDQIKINNAENYPKILFQKNNIIADYEIRKETILKKIKETAQNINGFAKNSNYLIEEVTALVESPTALLATFEKKFLKMPKKILIYTIEKQQKCFPIYNSKKELLPYFIFISNINSKEPEKIIIGNQKVMHARLSDANFFFKNDRKVKLEHYLLSLKKVLFHNNLGSLYEKTLRLQLLIEWIAKYSHSNVQDAIRSAMLSKCDLVTNTVCEFPELQGTIGMYCALEDQEKKDIAIALKEQYLPAFSGDKLPYTSIGCALSITDKMDTLSGMFYVGNTLSSDKDPFGLRRLAIGIIRIIIEKNILLDLKDLINKSLYLYNKENSNNTVLSNKIIKFFIKRLFYWYQETGYSIKVIKSVLSYQSTQLIDIHQKIQAISFFQKLESSKSIILSIKRISNILEKENEKITGYINIKLMIEAEEIILFNQIENFNIYTRTLFLEKRYQDILVKIKDLEKPICNFFKKVKIHHPNSRIRLNRLLILDKLKKFSFP
ncbi:glycyl-tRNA synthetase beta chain [Buchnera aphidicola str. Ak (Acyrthosiphon kondoi)]|uniref:Glycine--tRNA ligase beta subunit n=1 Tax=Buchnera aphidicola str. Ak (Acyrthosiphon kondoi) TaxID=1005090 RepID=G2LMK7_9GAMM|nr:glycine--tRNA ligase subunit beta [Buchnera aphidicola]AEO08495.1 glycyl-tRNA synthetase beta chain [Buchnera aphidicola str. Ak (Acyrthosiphon kondoi)]